MNALIDYTLYLADNSLILGQRNSEWCGHGPVLEQDIAITNISLDLIGQARNFYQYAAILIGNGATEDSLAYLRKEREFKNCLLVEQANGDWGQTILRQFFFSAYQCLLYKKMQESNDAQNLFLRQRGAERSHLRSRDTAGNGGVERGVAAAMSEPVAGEARRFGTLSPAAMTKCASFRETAFTCLDLRPDIVRECRATCGAHCNHQQNVAAAIPESHCLVPVAQNT